MRRQNGRDKSLVMDGVFSTIGNIRIQTDSMTYHGRDRVLPIFEEEQVLMCQLMSLKPGQRVLDAGTGSGVLAIHAAKQGCIVKAVDICPRAITFARDNCRANEVDIELILGPYTDDTSGPGSMDIVIMNPPHHPTPSGIVVALHAHAGEDGLAVFWDFLEHARRHIKMGGKVYFYQMTPARDGKPKIFEMIDSLFVEGYSIRFTRVLSTTSNRHFLKAVYGEGYSNWVNEMASSYPELDLIYGEISRGGLRKVEEFSHGVSLSRGWDDRIKLHQEIRTSGRRKLT